MLEHREQHGLYNDRHDNDHPDHVQETSGDHVILMHTAGDITEPPA